MIVATVPEHITLLQRILPLAAALLVAASTVELLRRRKLREEYALLWIAASMVLGVFAIFPRLLWHLSNAIGTFYLTTLVVLLFSFLALVAIHLSVVASRVGEDVRKMAQRVALLEHKLAESGKSEEAGDRGSEPTED